MLFRLALPAGPLALGSAKPPGPSLDPSQLSTSPAWPARGHCVALLSARAPPARTLPHPHFPSLPPALAGPGRHGPGPPAPHVGPLRSHRPARALSDPGGRRAGTTPPGVGGARLAGRPPATLSERGGGPPSQPSLPPCRGHRPPAEHLLLGRLHRRPPLLSVSTAGRAARRRSRPARAPRHWPGPRQGGSSPEGVPPPPPAVVVEPRAAPRRPTLSRRSLRADPRGQGCAQPPACPRTWPRH